MGARGRLRESPKAEVWGKPPYVNLLIEQMGKLRPRKQKLASGHSACQRPGWDLSPRLGLNFHSQCPEPTWGLVGRQARLRVVPGGI